MASNELWKIFVYQSNLCPKSNIGQCLNVNHLPIQVFLLPTKITLSMVQRQWDELKNAGSDLRGVF
jgi:hypothetical protein